MIYQMNHVTVKGQQNIKLEDVSFDIAKNHLVALISTDDSAGNVLRVLAGLDGVDSGTVAYAGLSGEDQSLMGKEIQYVPDDIVCYSGLTVSEFLKGMTDNNMEMIDEAARLLSLFNIDVEEPLLDMTFENNRLVSIIQAMMAKPSLLLLNRPYDMLSKQTYMLLLKELVALYAAGSTVVIAAERYEDVVMTCHDYIFLKEGKVIGSFGKNQLPRPAKVVTLWGGSISSMMPDKLKMLVKRKNYCRFLYQETDMKEMALRIGLTGCSNFNVEELTMEEMLFENYERWLS